MHLCAKTSLMRSLTKLSVAVSLMLSLNHNNTVTSSDMYASVVVIKLLAVSELWWVELVMECLDEETVQ